jgi:hypothetical protein
VLDDLAERAAADVARRPLHDAKSGHGLRFLSRG